MLDPEWVPFSVLRIGEDCGSDFSEDMNSLLVDVFLVECVLLFS